MLRPHGAQMGEERYKRQFRNDFRVRQSYVERALHWLKRHHPDYRNITISQPNLLALPIDRDVSDQVLNVEEFEEMKDKEPGQKGDGRACLRKRTNRVLIVIFLGRLKKPWPLTSTFVGLKQSS
ncbi:hypothetical protein OIDMADRAFT_31044 [Oidiodendron maius Zn]|uniref:DUF6570 domain-containing protein n=1 Tax=Oidiodendron maius (strain Zn) TaxID=913774 RepID=A0A0C3GQB8_OIDMZ|nr:hypothetical protein OIDMADRAFT_31044 [Oidiodendron maius Zn]